MKIQTCFRALRIFLLIFIVCLPVLVNSAEQARGVQKKEMAKQMQRITKLLRPVAKQKVDRSKKVFQHRMFSQERDIDCYREALQAVQREFRNSSTKESEVLMYSIMYETQKSP